MLVNTGKETTTEWLETPFLESLWTIYPCFIILIIVAPSIFVLYKITYETNTLFSVKITGHQWYWSYDYRSFFDLEFDRYTLPRDILEIGETRLIDVDNRLILPLKVPLQFLITSYDVIHSFSVPRIGIKLDCNPAYLNTIKTTFPLPGIYYALCREICASAHRQISICCEITTIKLFKLWLGITEYK